MRKMDMLHGSIGDKTVSFAILLAVTGICQQLFNAIDIIIMGRFVGKEAMAAVGSNAPVVGLLVTFFVGISLGANVVISQYTGQGNLEKVKKAVHTTIVFAVLTGILFAVLGDFQESGRYEDAAHVPLCGRHMQGMSEPFPCRLLRHGCRRRGGFHRLCDAHELFASSLPHEEYEERDPHFLP